MYGSIDQSPAQIKEDHNIDGFSGEDKDPLQNTEEIGDISQEENTFIPPKTFPSIQKAITLKRLLLIIFLFLSFYIILESPIFSSLPEKIFQKTYVFPHLTTIKGKSDEAYAFLLCTRKDADNADHMHFEALLVILYRLQKLKDNKRDIIVLVCQHNSFEEYETLLGLEDIIVIPVQSINIHDI